MTPNDPIIKTLLAGAKHNLENNPELIPVFFLINEKKEISAIATPFDDEQSKDMVASVIRKKAAEHEATVIVFISECWTMKASASEEDALAEYSKWRASGKSLSEHPNAEENLVVTIETPTSTQTGAAHITEDRKLGEFEWMAPETTSGRFANLLGEKPVRH